MIFLNMKNEYLFLIMYCIVVFVIYLSDESGVFCKRKDLLF